MLHMNRSTRFLAPIALGTTLLAGCAIGPDYKRPDAPAPTADHYKTPDSASSQSANQSGAPADKPADKWWAAFGDDLLNSLEDQVEVNNQNIAMAMAAYMQARAVVSLDRSNLWPVVGATASANRSGGGGKPTSTTYQLTGTASWELDVWGRLRRTLENAKANAQASAADLASAKLSAQSQLAIAYLQLRGADAERKMLVETQTGYARTLTITQNRYAVGTVARTDVLSAQTQLYSVQNQEQGILLQRAQLENAIAALIGKSASDFSIAARDEWNLPIPQTPAGVPSQLLTRRADIAAAERSMAAANAIIGVQEAAYLPSITLSGNYGFASSILSNLFDAGNGSHSFGGSLSQTLLDFGGRRAQVAQARASYAQSVASYRQTVLSAFESVENDLAAHTIYTRQFDILTNDSKAADLAEQLTLNQYNAGTVDMTTVVVQQASALNARIQLAQMKVQLQTNAVTLVTDMGGGWEAPDYSHYD